MASGSDKIYRRKRVANDPCDDKKYYDPVSGYCHPCTDVCHLCGKNVQRSGCQKCSSVCSKNTDLQTNEIPSFHSTIISLNTTTTHQPSIEAGTSWTVVAVAGTVSLLFLAVLAAVIILICKFRPNWLNRSICRRRRNSHPAPTLEEERGEDIPLNHVTTDTGSRSHHATGQISLNGGINGHATFSVSNETNEAAQYQPAVISSSAGPSELTPSTSGSNQEHSSGCYGHPTLNENSYTMLPSNSLNPVRHNDPFSGAANNPPFTSFSSQGEVAAASELNIENSQPAAPEVPDREQNRILDADAEYCHNLPSAKSFPGAANNPPLTSFSSQGEVAATPELNIENSAPELNVENSQPAAPEAPDREQNRILDADAEYGHNLPSAKVI